MEFKYIVEEKHNSKKAFEVLDSVFGMSSLMQKKIRLYGNLWVNGEHHRMIDPVYTGDFIMAHPTIKIEDLVPAKINKVPGIDILFEDDHLLVVNKPPKIVVHPTRSHPDKTLIDLLSDKKLHTVTRLDRETSGAIIIAKHGHAHYRITQKPIKRIYWALTHGIWQNKEGTIDASIRRCQDSFMIRVVASDGKKAVTHYRVKDQVPEENYSWLEFQLQTGRTHQIRVHSLYHAHPLLGDGLYGLSDYYEQTNDEIVLSEIEKLDTERIQNLNQINFRKLVNKNQVLIDQRIDRQALHARIIGFSHPIHNKYIEIEAPLPEDMQKLLPEKFEQTKDY